MFTGGTVAEARGGDLARLAIVRWNSAAHAGAASMEAQQMLSMYDAFLLDPRRLKRTLSHATGVFRSDTHVAKLHYTGGCEFALQTFPRSAVGVCTSTGRYFASPQFAQQRCDEELGLQPGKSKTGGGGSGNDAGERDGGEEEEEAGENGVQEDPETVRKRHQITVHHLRLVPALLRPFARVGEVQLRPVNGAAAAADGGGDEPGDSSADTAKKKRKEDSADTEAEGKESKEPAGPYAGPRITVHDGTLQAVELPGHHAMPEAELTIPSRFDKYFQGPHMVKVLAALLDIMHSPAHRTKFVRLSTAADVSRLLVDLCCERVHRFLHRPVALLVDMLLFCGYMRIEVGTEEVFATATTASGSTIGMDATATPLRPLNFGPADVDRYLAVSAADDAAKLLLQLAAAGARVAVVSGDAAATVTPGTETSSRPMTSHSGASTAVTTTTGSGSSSLDQATRALARFSQRFSSALSPQQLLDALNTPLCRLGDVVGAATVFVQCDGDADADAGTLAGSESKEWYASSVTSVLTAACAPLPSSAAPTTVCEQLRAEFERLASLSDSSRRTDQ